MSATYLYLIDKKVVVHRQLEQLFYIRLPDHDVTRSNTHANSVENTLHISNATVRDCEPGCLWNTVAQLNDGCFS